MKVVLKRIAIATSAVACGRCCRSVGLNIAEFRWESKAPRRGSIDPRPRSGLPGLRVDSPGGLYPGRDCSRLQSPPPPRLGTTMTTIAMMTLTQVGATLLAIITAVILAATASVVATPAELYTRPTLFPRYYGSWVR